MAYAPAMSARVAAIVVTYHCGKHIAQALAALLTQVQNVYIIDNHSGPEAIGILKHCAAQYPDRIRLTLNDDNLGIAAAQNQGIRQALADGCEWVLLMDDDSVPAPGMVGKMLAAWQQHGDARVGIVAPLFKEQNVEAPARYLVPRWGGLGFTRQILKEGETLHDVAMVIASGSLIRAEIFSETGLMAEGFFIDGVDHEFCLRARQRGYGILVTGNAVLHHRQGDKRRRHVLGLPVVTANYSAARRYYIFRNRLFLLRRYARQFPFLLPYVIATSAWDVVRILAAEPDKAGRLKAALRGLAHGLLRAVPREAAF